MRRAAAWRDCIAIAAAAVLVTRGAHAGPTATTAGLVSGPTLAEPNEPARVQPLDASSELVAPRLPTPFMLPELAHPRVDGWVSWTLGSVLARTATSNDVAVGLVRAGGEAHVFLFRRFYIGAELPIALGRPVEGARELGGAPAAAGSRVLAGNLEAHARIVFPMPSWLAFGLLLGVSVPTATFDRNGPAQATARAAAALSPTEVVGFLPGRLTYRPALDVRILRGPFVVQLRQGIDIVQDVSTGGATTQGRILAHAGVLVSRDVELVIEGQQLYRFGTGPDIVSDRRRSAVVAGPGARVSLGRFDVGGMLLSSVADPLGTEMESVLAVQASVVAHLP